MASGALDLYVAERTRAFLRSVLPWASAILAGLGLVYLVAPPITPGTPYATAAFVIAAIEGLMGWGVARVPARRVGWMAFAAALVAQGFGLVFLARSGDLAQSVVLVITLLGAAYGLPSAASAVGLSVITLGAWIVLAHGQPAAAVTHWATNLCSTAMLAIVMTVMRVRSLRHQGVVEQQLRDATRAARSAAAAKSEFLATMSHEMRTPLHGIFGMTEIAFESSDDPAVRDLLERTRACAATLLALVDDVLDFARIEARTLRLDDRPFDPRATIEAVTEPLRLAARAKSLALDVTIAPEVPARLSGDGGRIGQIVVNLVSNAIKFTDRGGVTLRLDVEDRQAAPGVVLRGTVTDTGVGIAPEVQERLFDAFMQGDPSMTRRHDGVGLGLAIVRALTQMMGGNVTVCSAVGAGSTFSFHVRLGRVPVAGAGTAAAA